MTVARFGDGLGVGPDLLAAAESATAQALAPLGGRRPDLAAVFVSGDDPEAMAAAGLRAAECSRAATVVGCTAAGVIGGQRGVENVGAVSVWAAVLPEVTARAFHLRTVRSSGGLAVVGLPERAAEQVMVLLADPWSFPVDGFVSRSNDVLPGLAIVGGLAAGPAGRGSTRLILDDRVVDEGAVGVLLGGAVSARPAVSQGCRPVGPSMVVTAAAGSTLLELAGVPALSKLREVVAGLEPLEQELVASGLQLGLAMDEYADEHARGDFLVRGVVGADPERGALMVGDVVEVGRTVRFQVRDAETADADLRAVLADLRAAAGEGGVEGALLFSCTGRGAGLFDDVTHDGPDHDVRAVRRELATSGVAGFFAGGEIGPVGGRNFLHGFTASVLAFSTEPLTAAPLTAAPLTAAPLTGEADAVGDRGDTEALPAELVADLQAPDLTVEDVIGAADDPRPMEG